MIEINNIPIQANSAKPLQTAVNAKDGSPEIFSDILTDVSEIQNLEILSSTPEPDSIPAWVDEDYGYDPNHPRNPNIRELIQAISGQSLEDLRKGNPHKFSEIAYNAKELLYGVTNNGNDPRDWHEIMASKDIVSAARMATSAHFDFQLTTHSVIEKFDETDVEMKLDIVITDNDQNILKILNDAIENTKTTLFNYGITQEKLETFIENHADIPVQKKQVFTDILRNYASAQVNATKALANISFDTYVFEGST